MLWGGSESSHPINTCFCEDLRIFRGLTWSFHCKFHLRGRAVVGTVTASKDAAYAAMASTTFAAAVTASAMVARVATTTSARWRQGARPVAGGGDEGAAAGQRAATITASVAQQGAAAHPKSITALTVAVATAAAAAAPRVAYANKGVPPPPATMPGRRGPLRGSSVHPYNARRGAHPLLPPRPLEAPPRACSRAPRWRR